MAHTRMTAGSTVKSDCILDNIFKVEPLGFADRPDVEYKGRSKQVQKYSLFYKFTKFLDTFRHFDRACHVTSFNGRVQVINPAVSL